VHAIGVAQLHALFDHSGMHGVRNCLCYPGVITRTPALVLYCMIICLLKVMSLLRTAGTAFSRLLPPHMPVQNLTTDDAGVAVGTIDLGNLPAANISYPGDSLSLTATWVGPTRELIERTASVR
jgi:hypothetical protein